MTVENWYLLHDALKFVQYIRKRKKTDDKGRFSIHPPKYEDLVNHNRLISFTDIC